MFLTNLLGKVLGRLMRAGEHSRLASTPPLSSDLDCGTNAGDMVVIRHANAGTNVDALPNMFFLFASEWAHASPHSLCVNDAAP